MMYYLGIGFIMDLIRSIMNPSVLGPNNSILVDFTLFFICGKKIYYLCKLFLKANC